MAASQPDPEPQIGRRLGDFGVELLKAQTAELRALDYRSGGGSCLDAVLTLLHRVNGAFDDTDATDYGADVAIADLYTLAGWACFDIGLTDRAQVHFAQALVLAGRGHNACLIANIFYRLGRVRLHHGNPAGALEFFQAGRRTAEGADCWLEASILSMNQAWAHAAMGAEPQARAMVDRGEEQFAVSAGAQVPGWAKYFTTIDKLAMVGTVYTELAHRVDPRHARVAIPALTKATDSYGDDMARSRTFSLIMLAMNLLVDGEVDRGVAIGLRALAAAESLLSVRVRDRMHPLKRDAELHDSHAGARDLAARIAAFTP